MANRVSEPAPAPPTATPAPVSTRSPAAQKMGIPDFPQDGENAQTVAISWNDYDANDGGGMPVGDASPGVSMDGTDRPDAGRPTKGKKTTVNVDGTDAAPDPDKHLDAHASEGDVEVEAPAEEEVVIETPKVMPSDRRRAALANLEREQQIRGVETNLIAERSKREALENKLKTATLGELLKLRGLDPEAALELLVHKKEGDVPPEPTAEDKAKATRDAEVDDLKKWKASLEAKEARLEHQRIMGLTTEDAMTVKEAPVVHVALKKNFSVDTDDSGQPLTAAQWIYGLASAEWIKAGKPDGKQKAYVRAATLVLEDKLVADNSDIADAVAAKRGAVASTSNTTTREPSEPRPQSMRRPAARPEARPAPLPRDRDSLDLELKKRFNLR